MNTKRIEDLLAHLRKAVEEGEDVIDMENWQKYEKHPAADLDELHYCGNKACLGGFVALLPMFRLAGGEMLPSNGAPRFCSGLGAAAVGAYLEISPELADMLCSSPYGEPLNGASLHNVLYSQIMAAAKGLDWFSWTAETLIDIFEALLKGEIVDAAGGALAAKKR